MASEQVPGILRQALEAVLASLLEAVARALGVESLSKSAIGRMTETLDAQVKAFRERDLPAASQVFLDARCEHVREDHAVRKMAVMVALGVREDGRREVLGFSVARIESAPLWGDFLMELTRHGLRGVRLVVSDAREGLRRAIERHLTPPISQPWRQQRLAPLVIRSFLLPRVALPRHRPAVGTV